MLDLVSISTSNKPCLDMLTAFSDLYMKIQTPRREVRARKLRQNEDPRLGWV